MSTEKNKYITSTPGKNTLKNPFIIYADLECLFYPISTCDNTEDNSFTIRKNKHKPSGYSLLTSYAYYDNSLNEHIFYRGNDCMSRFSQLSFFFNSICFFRKLSNLKVFKLQRSNIIKIYFII